MTVDATPAPSLDTLAAAAGMSPYHFLRVFKARLGITPKQYAMSLRRQRATQTLPGAENVTDAMDEAGYGSSSQFYGESDATLGMAPTVYCRGAAGEVIRFGVVQCYLGWVLVAATGRGVCAIDLGDDPMVLETELRVRFSQAQIDPDPDLGMWTQQVVRFLETPARGLDLPLDIQGTAFQCQVWAALREIPAGHTLSYTAVAAHIGAPSAARAVAGACAANQLAVVIPCHRVVRQNGDLSGYRWGIERKQKLLAREQEPS